MPDVGGYTPAKKKRKNPIRERLSAEKPDPKPEMTKEERERWKKLQSPPRRAYAHTLPTYTDEQKRRVEQMRRGVDRGATPKTPTQSEINKRSEEAKKAKRRETLKRILSGRLSTAMKEQARSDTSRASRKAEKIVTGGEKPTTIGSYNLPEVKRRRRAVKNMTKVILRDMKRKKDERAKYMRHQSPNGYDGVVDNRGKK